MRVGLSKIAFHEGLRVNHAWPGPGFRRPWGRKKNVQKKSFTARSEKIECPREIAPRENTPARRRIELGRPHFERSIYYLEPFCVISRSNHVKSADLSVR